METFWGHLDALRKTLIRIGLVVIISTALSFCFYSDLFRFLLAPLDGLDGGLRYSSVQIERIISTKKVPQIFELYDETEVVVPLQTGVKKVGERSYELQPGSYLDYKSERKPYLLLGPLDGFLAALKVSLWVGIVSSSPLSLFLLLRFLVPALSNTERGYILPLLTLFYVLLILGFLFAYFVTLPIVNSFFFTFNDAIGENRWTLGSMLQFTLWLLLAHAAAFELFGILLALIHLRLVPAQKLQKWRKIAIVAILTLSAILTPPDVLSQVLMALPLYIFYEISIFYAKRRERVIIPVS